jgi:hypothetical protein
MLKYVALGTLLLLMIWAGTLIVPPEQPDKLVPANPPATYRPTMEEIAKWRREKRESDRQELNEANRGYGPGFEKFRLEHQRRMDDWYRGKPYVNRH